MFIFMSCIFCILNVLRAPSKMGEYSLGLPSLNKILLLKIRKQLKTGHHIIVCNISTRSQLNYCRP